MSPHHWREHSIRAAVFGEDDTTAQLDARLRNALGRDADLEAVKRRLKDALDAHDEGRFNDCNEIITELAGGAS